jgi:hypothetical protein
MRRRLRNAAAMLMRYAPMATTESPMKYALLLALSAGLALGSSAKAQTQPPAEPSAQAPAQAQEKPATAPDGNNRYSFHRIGEGFVRLDGRTGQLAQCGWSATGWSCKAVPDERAALDSEIARLQRENAALKKSLLTRGLDLPSGVIADVPAATRPVPPADIPDAGRDKSQPPSAPTEAEFDRAVAFVKNVWRRLVEMMVELQRDIQRKS